MKLSIKKKVTLILSFLVVPLFLYILASTGYIIRSASKEIARSYQEGMQMYCTDLENRLEMIENQMAITVINDVNFQRLSTRLNEYDYQNYTYNLLQTFKEWLSLNPVVASYGILSEKNEKNRFAFNDSNVDVSLKFAIPEFFESDYESYKKEKTWFYLELDQTPFLVRLIGLKDTDMICLVNLNTLPTIEVGDEKETGTMLFCKEEKALTEKEFVEEKKIEFLPGKDAYYTVSAGNTNYMVIPEQIASTQIRVVYVIEHNALIQSFQGTVIVVFFIAVLMCMVIPLVYYLLRKTFFKPVDNLVAIMGSINEVGAEPDYDAYHWDSEFKVVIDVFRKMMSQMKLLQELNRKKELEKQQVETQYLQLQIRPHFFLNCLKNVYSLAGRQDYRMIQSAILELSSYFRSIMLDNQKQIPLKKELDHVKSYLALEKILSGREVNCSFSVELPLLKKDIPPLSILTFVENSVKYGYGDNMVLDICIEISSRTTDAEKRMEVRIADRGKGFSEKELEAWNGSSDGADGHIGIRNVRKRFEILFGDRCNFRFYTEHGAVVEFSFPVMEQENPEGETL